MNKKKIIDLRSDTTSLPTEELTKAMSQATVGDSAYGEDKAYNEFIEYCKNLFDVEDAIFVTSGMLANRLAFLSQTEPGDEVITEYNYHVNFFDSAAMAKICNVVMNTVHTKDGVLTKDDVLKSINTKIRYKIFAQVKLVTIENSINGWQGKIFPFEKQQELYEFLKKQNIKLHLDGARIFNSHVETNITLKSYAKYCDTMSFCLSKGLGAPFGSVLLGKKETIEKARRFQVWLGSGFHQIGFNAKAAHYALEKQLYFVKQDNSRAKFLYYELQKNCKEFLSDVPETNIVNLDISKLNLSNDQFLKRCEQNGLLLFPWLEGNIRAVVCHNINEDDVVQAAKIIKEVLYKDKPHE
jgi:threonine aldolase